MKFHLFQLGFCCLASILFLPSAMGQKEANLVSFYYIVGKHVHKGNVKIEIDLYHNGRKLPSADVVDCRKYLPKELDVRVTISAINWGSSTHKDRYKLAFGDEYIIPGDGFRRKGSESLYLGGNRQSVSMVFELTSFQGLSTSGLMLAFFVLDQKATFDDIEHSSAADGKVLGFGSYIHPLTLVPAGYKESEEGEIEMYSLFNTILISGLNSSFEDLSYELADYIKKGDYQGFERKIEEKGQSSYREVSGNKKSTPKPKQTKPADADDRAFKKASTANTVDAYQKYLSEYPRGRHAETAKRQVLELTPFDIQVDESFDGPFKYYTVSFREGVGNARPILTLTNNEDWAVKEEWTGHRQVQLKLPPERTVKATFSLGRKSTSLELAHGEFHFSEDKDTKPPASPDADTPNNHVAFSILLALPFLGAITYLLYKKHR
jgi:hypothetical protein